MSPLTVFIRTLAKSTAIFLGAALICINPSLSLTGTRPVTAQKSPPEAATDALIGALKDSDAEVRKQSAPALQQNRYPGAVLALIDALRAQYGEVRSQGMWALSQSRARRATSPIPVALKAADPKIRCRAASALAEFRDPASIDALVAAV